MTKQEVQEQNRKLKPLMESLPRTQIMFVDRRLRWVCTGCGVEARQLMIRRHKPKCPWIAHYEAIDFLREMLR